MAKRLKLVAIKCSSPFLLLLLNFIDFSCKQNEPPYVYKCQDGFIEYQNVTNIRFADNVSSTDTLITLVIRSKEDFNKYFLDLRGNQFDFEKNTLLAGRYKAPNVDKVLNQTIKSFCAYNVLYYDIQLESGMLPASSKVPFFVIIPKIPANTTVQFHVHY